MNEAMELIRGMLDLMERERDTYLARLRLRPTSRVGGLRRSLDRECLWLRSPVHDELW
jgi:hypothetical protein